MGGAYSSITVTRWLGGGKRHTNIVLAFVRAKAGYAHGSRLMKSTMYGRSVTASRGTADHSFAGIHKPTSMIRSSPPSNEYSDSLNSLPNWLNINGWSWG